jgi:hypothetical protein
MTATQTLPQTIDGEILELAYRLGSLMSQEQLQNRRQVQLDERNHDGSLDAEWQTVFNAWLETLDTIAEVQHRVSALENVHTVYGWSRAFIVSGGHVHKTMSCHTCYSTTVFYGVPQCSGMDEDEIVELAGERACTVCYPTAPVDVLKRKTQLFTRDEAEKQRISDERAAKRNAKEAAKVTVFLPLECKGGATRTFGTVRSAEIEAVDAYGWAISSAAHYNGNTIARNLSNFEAIVAAVAERRRGDLTLGAAIELIEIELILKAEKKFLKEACGKDITTGKPFRTKAEALELLEKAREVIASK